MTAGAWLRCQAANYSYINQWDEAYHALVAQNFLTHPFEPVLLNYVPSFVRDYNWLLTRNWLHKPPLAMWSMALSMRVFGSEEWVLRLPSIILDVCLIALIAIAGKTFISSRVGLASAFIWACCPAAIELSSASRATDHPDVFLCFFLNLSLIGAAISIDNHKLRWPLISGLGLGFAILSKGLAALALPIAYALYIAFQSVAFRAKETKWKLHLQHLLAFAGGAAIAIPWSIYTRIRYPAESAWESSYALRHIYEVIEEHEGEWFYHFERIADWGFGLNGQEAAFVTMGLVIICAANGFFKKNRFLMLLGVWVIFCFAFFSFCATKMKYYCFPAYPAFLLLACSLLYGVNTSSAKNTIRTKVRHLSATILVTAISVVFANRSLGIIENIHGQKRLQALSQNYQYEDMREKMLRLREDSARAVVWNAKDNIFVQASFYSGKSVLPFRPGKGDIEEASGRGVKNYVLVGSSFEREEIESELEELALRVVILEVQATR